MGPLEDIPGDLFDELARIRRVEFDTEIERVNVRARISFMNLQLLAELFALIEPLLKCTFSLVRFSK